MRLSDYYPELKGWVPAPDVNPTSLPQLPTPEVQVSPYLRTVLPLPLQYTPDTLKQSNRPGLSSFRVAPQSPSSFPAINAAARSAVTSAIAQAIANIPSGGTVSLDVPNIFTPITQTVTLPGPLAFSLATEPLGTVFQVPPPGLSSVEGFATSTVNTGGTSGGSLSMTVTPTTATSWGLYVGAGNNDITPSQPGWTGFTGNSSTGTIMASFYKAFSGTSPVTTSFSFPTNSSETAMLALFSGALPTIVSQASASATPNTTTNLAFSPSNIAGNTLLVILTSVNASPQPAFSLSATDSAGNAYQTLTVQQGGGIHPPSILVLIAPNCIGGANTVHATVTGLRGGGSGAFLQIIEMTPFSAGPQTPIFAPLTPSQIPPINLAGTGQGGVFGILPIQDGGTGLNMSTTGGTSQFLKQNALGGPITVVQPDYPDLAGAVGAFATSYNGVPLVSNGIPSEIAKSDPVAQTAALGPLTLIAAPASGMYRVSYVAKLETPAATSSTLGGATGFQVIYTDADDSVVVTTPAWWGGGNNGAAPASASLNTTQTQISGDFIINAKASTGIQYQFGYTSSGATPMAYVIHVKVEAL